LKLNKIIDHLKGNVEYIATVYHPEKSQYSSLLYDQEYLNI